MERTRLLPILLSLAVVAGLGSLAVSQEIFQDAPWINLTRNPKPLIPSATNQFFVADPGGNVISIASPAQQRRFTNSFGTTIYITAIEVWMTANTFQTTGLQLKSNDCTILVATNFNIAGKVNNAFNFNNLLSPIAIPNGQIFYVRYNVSGFNESKGFAGGWRESDCVADAGAYQLNTNFKYYTLIEAP